MPSTESVVVANPSLKTAPTRLDTLHGNAASDARDTGIVSVPVVSEVQPDARIDFETVVCGVDISPESAEAVEQGAALAADDARLYALSAWDPGLATFAGIHAQEVAADLREESLTALRRAKEAVPNIEQLHFKGAPVACLVAAAEHRIGLPYGSLRSRSKPSRRCT